MNGHYASVEADILLLVCEWLIRAHSLRQLVAQDKVAYVRAGSGVRGKILVSKASLLKYLGVAN